MGEQERRKGWPTVSREQALPATRESKHAKAHLSSQKLLLQDSFCPNQKVCQVRQNAGAAKGDPSPLAPKKSAKMRRDIDDLAWEDLRNRCCDMAKGEMDEKRIEAEKRSDSQDRLYKIFGVDGILNMALPSTNPSPTISLLPTQQQIEEEIYISDSDGDDLASRLKENIQRPSNSKLLLKPPTTQPLKSQLMWRCIKDPSNSNSTDYSLDAAPKSKCATNSPEDALHLRSPAHHAPLPRSSPTLGSSAEPNFSIDFSKIHEVGKTALNIKNIPNKYTKEMLLKLIDEEFEGKYTFFYLPIDFNQKCNMGFAFIKLTDVKTVEQFYRRFQGKKWPKFNSEKICDLKYARLQNSDELKTHFNNSNLMRHTDACYKPYMRLREFESDTRK